MELRRFGFADWTAEAVSERECSGSRSVAEKERFREGERKELGDKEGRRWEGEG